ncbi:unnamed protein product, partial [Ixodes hexagonus]
MEDCDAFIRSSIQSTNLCEVMDYTMKHGILTNFDGVIDRLLEVNADQVLKSESFIAASKGTVIKILKNPRLCLKEYDVIKSVRSWVIAHCGTDKKLSALEVQQAMRPFLPELRLLTLTSMEFVE